MTLILQSFIETRGRNIE